MRRVIAFLCGETTLFGTLDEASSATGLLIVSGGNEIRIGSHRGMASLAKAIVAEGFPVLRYDRRGIGDSEGENRGFLSASDDLRAAVAAFRDAGVTRIVGFGNCDAASTLALFGRAAGIDSVLLANPWTIEDNDDLPPAAAIRARYAERLIDPATWKRLVSGKVDIGKAIRGLRKVVAPIAPSPLANRVTAAIRAWGNDAAILLAQGDATAIAFRAAAPTLPATTLPTDSHSFARDADRAALERAVLDRLRAAAAR